MEEEVGHEASLSLSACQELLTVLSSPNPLALWTENTKLREGKDPAHRPQQAQGYRTGGCPPTPFLGLQAQALGSCRPRSELQLCHMPGATMDKRMSSAGFSFLIENPGTLLGKCSTHVWVTVRAQNWGLYTSDYLGHHAKSTC